MINELKECWWRRNNPWNMHMAVTHFSSSILLLFISSISDTKHCNKISVGYNIYWKSVEMILTPVSIGNIMASSYLIVYLYLAMYCVNACICTYVPFIRSISTMAWSVLQHLDCCPHLWILHCWPSTGRRIFQRTEADVSFRFSVWSILLKLHRS